MTGTLTVPSNGSVGRGSRSRAVPKDENTAASNVSATGSALLTDDDDPVLGTSHRAADVDEMALRVDLLDPEMSLRVLLVAVVTGHLLALDHARRVGARSDRTGPAVLRVTVRVRSAAKRPALDDALEPAALRRARHLHLVAHGEDPDIDGRPDGERRHFGGLRTIIQPDRAQHGRRRIESRLLGVTDSGLARATPARGVLALRRLATHALRAITQLGLRHPRLGLVADHENRVGRRLDDRARDLLPVRVEDLGHSDLLTDDSDHWATRP